MYPARSANYGRALCGSLQVVLGFRDGCGGIIVGVVVVGITDSWLNSLVVVVVARVLAIESTFVQEVSAGMNDLLGNSCIFFIVPSGSAHYLVQECFLACCPVD